MFSEEQIFRIDHFLGKETDLRRREASPRELALGRHAGLSAHWQAAGAKTHRGHRPVQKDTASDLRGDRARQHATRSPSAWRRRPAFTTRFWPSNPARISGCNRSISTSATAPLLASRDRRVLTSGCCTTRCAATRRFSRGRTGFLARGSSSILSWKSGPPRREPTCQITKPDRGVRMPLSNCSGATAADGMRGHPQANRHKIL